MISPTKKVQNVLCDGIEVEEKIILLDFFAGIDYITSYINDVNCRQVVIDIDFLNLTVFRMCY